MKSLKKNLSTILDYNIYMQKECPWVNANSANILELSQQVFFI